MVLNYLYFTMQVSNGCPELRLGAISLNDGENYQDARLTQKKKIKIVFPKLFETRPPG